MIGVPIAPRRVYGVSVAAGTEAGRDTWVCRATPGADGLRLERVDPVAELPGGAVDHDAAMRSLLVRILEAPASAWGLELPFGCAEPPGGARRTDREHDLGRELSADRQGQARIADAHLLRPLRQRPGVVVLPLDPLPMLPPGTPAAMAAAAPSTYVLEVEAAACRARLAREVGGVEARPDADADAAREAWLRHLVANEQLRPLRRALRTRISGEARAFDAVVDAVAAWRGYRLYDHAALHADPEYRTEGHIYC